MIKTRVNEYEITDNRIKNNMKILVMSDIHSHDSFLDGVLNYVKKEKIDFILVPGDTLDTVKEKNNKELKDKLIEISNYSKIYVSIGNHDEYKSKGIDNITIPEFFNQNEKNIIFLKEPFNKIKDIVNIYALNLPYRYYKNGEKNENLDKYISLKENMISDKEFNILLCHTPNPLLKDNNIIDNNLLNKMSLIVCGHNHSGLTPMFIQEKSKTKKGLVGPCKTFLQPNAFGYYTNLNTTLIISNGITKIAKSSLVGKVLHPMNSFYIPDIDVINIKKGNKHNTKIIKRVILK